jgi:hypothetical protein
LDTLQLQFLGALFQWWQGIEPRIGVDLSMPRSSIKRVRPS